MLLGIAGTLYLSDQLSKEWTIPARAYLKIQEAYTATFATGTAPPIEIHTNRLILEAKTMILPLEAADYGGGIAAAGGDGILIVDRVGSFFLVNPDRWQQLSINAPDNGAGALRKQASDGDLGGIKIDFKNFRFNDVLLAKSETGMKLLVSYTEWFAQDKCYGSTLASIDISPAQSLSELEIASDQWTILRRTKPCLELVKGRAMGIFGQEAGGRLVQPDPERPVIVWSNGVYELDDYFEGQDFSNALAQNERSDYGSLIEIDLGSGKEKILARGLRNPQGLAAGRDGKIWVTDHGQAGGDELNLVSPAANFGYPAVSFGRAYDRSPIGNRPFHALHDGFDLPALAFVPSIAPSSAIVINDFHYTWNGNVLVGAYKDKIHRVHYEDDRVLFVEPIDIGVRVRDLVQTERNSIAIWTDSRRVLFLDPSEKTSGNDSVKNQIATIANAERRSAVEVAFATCLSCHAFDREVHGIGPSLADVCGSAPGSTSFDQYSGALSQVSGRWTNDKLAAFILEPAEVAPGTTMSAPGISDVNTAEALAAAICPKATERRP